MKKRTPFNLVEKFRCMSSAPGRMPKRRGAVIVIVALLTVLLIVMLAFTIDIPYMQMVRTELRIATDAAAKAGAESLKRTQNAHSAIQAAIDVAAMNTVAGKPLQLNKSDIILGRCSRQPDGSCSFADGVQPYNGVRVSCTMDGKSKNGPVKLLFGSAVGVSSFQPHQDATAGQTMCEICLVLDRSHSMAFDLSGVPWRYPPSIPAYPAGYSKPPAANGSRWAALVTAVKSFMTIIGQQKDAPRVALVTWASDLSSAFPATVTDVTLASNKGQIVSSLVGRGQKEMWGATNMSAGIDAGTSVLTGSDVNPLADKVMILMTDGQWNQGRDPIQAAQDAKAAHVTIHTICLLAGASESVCQQVAEITGGTYTFAGNAAQLQQAFEKLAHQMQVVLIE